MTIQIAVKLPDGLVGELDQLVASGTFRNRTQAVRAGVETVVADQRRQDLDRRYREAMARYPETAEEMADATRSAIDAVNEEPWERWW